MANIEKMKEVFHAQLKAFMQGDWKTYKQFLSDGASYEEEATGRHVNGADEIVKTIEPWRRAFPDVNGKVKEAIAAGDAIVAEIEWTGTHKGALSGPFGTIAATNRQTKLPAVMVCRFDGEKIREMRHYFDLLSLLVQLGIAPQIGAGATR
jgi:steroid delta-isomerase-like uncharacterized protein